MGYLESFATMSLILLMLDVSVLSLTVTAPQSEYLYNEGETATLQCTYQLSWWERVHEITWERKRESDFNFIMIFRLLVKPFPANILTWYQEFYSQEPIKNPGRASFIGSSINGSTHSGIFSAAIQINSFVFSDDAKYKCAIKATTSSCFFNTSDQVDMEVRYNFLPNTPSIFLNYGGRFDTVQDEIINLAPNKILTMTCTGNVGRPNGMLRWEQSFEKSKSWGAIRDTVSSYQIMQNNTDGTAIGQITYSKILYVADDTIKFRCLADRESVGLSDVIISSVIQFKVPEHLSSTTITSVHDESPALKAALGTLMPILIILLVICLLLIAYLWRKLKAPAKNNGRCKSEATVNMTRRQLPAFTNAHSHIDSQINIIESNPYAHTNQGTTLHKEEKHYQTMHRPDVHTSNRISGNDSNVQPGEEEYENLEQRVYLELE